MKPKQVAQRCNCLKIYRQRRISMTTGPVQTLREAQQPGWTGERQEKHNGNNRLQEGLSPETQQWKARPHFLHTAQFCLSFLLELQPPREPLSFQGKNL